MPLVQFPLARPIPKGFLDRIEVDTTGVLRIIGWSKTSFDPKAAPRVLLDQDEVPFLQHYRVVRPDVQQRGSNILLEERGLVLEYLVPESMLSRRFGSLSVLLTEVPRRFEAAFEFRNPHYRPLLETQDVYHREDIYGSGPPNSVLNPETVALARQLSDPILDFGCGSGALVQHLRDLGLSAHGIELDTPVIRQSISTPVKPSITLYDGRFPSPFDDQSFKSVFCSEVLEHIPDFEAAIRDIARIATEKVIFTVPDASAIPAGWRHGVVPWHLLEGTHVNFFNQANLTRALTPFFSHIEFGRVGARPLNDGIFYVSLIAACVK